MAKTQSSLNALFVALIFPIATPTTRTRSPCATNSGGSGYVVSTSTEAFRSTSASPACPRCVPASGQSSPGMVHSISSATNASRPCLSPRPIAAKKSFTIWTFSCVLIEISPFLLQRIVSDLVGYDRNKPATGAREGTIASLKSDGLYSLDLPQGFQAGPQRVGPTLFGTIAYGRKAAVHKQLHWNGLMRTT